MSNRPIFEVKTSGIFFEDVKDWDKEIQTLTFELEKEEENSEYLKYFIRPMKMPSHESLAAAEKDCPLDEKDALRPENYLSVMNSEAINDVKQGFCVFSDGIGYAMSRTLIPDINDEMYEFFNKNFNPEHNLFYKCWCPGYHVKHYVNAAIEDVGAGMELIKFLSGYDVKAFSGDPDYEVKDPDFIAFEGGGGTSWPLHHLFEHPRWAIQANWWRDVPEINGREVFTCFWLGMKWENGKAVRAIPEDERINPQDVRCQCYHAALENTQAAYLVKKFWEDNH